MFQSYESSADRDKGPSRLHKLQAAMKKIGATHYLVPHADEHQNEYLPARAERLAWLTGFTGSAGFAIATLDKAVVFVDGRYTLQVQDQIDPNAFTSESLIDLPPSKWVEKNTGESDVIAYDPWVITQSQIKAYKKACKKTGATLLPNENLIDAIWDDQPAVPIQPVQLHPIEYAGKAAVQKCDDIQASLVDEALDAAVLTDPASLAWLFNIRGADVIHNPLALGFAIIPASGKPALFMADEKLSSEIRSELASIADIFEPELFLGELAKLSNGKLIGCDYAITASQVVLTIEEANGKTQDFRDPVSLPRAIKNQTEIEGARTAHIRDGVAYCKFLHWLDTSNVDDLDEISVSKQLEHFRTKTAEQMGSRLEEVSFDTISGFGANGAIVHYRVTTDSNRKFEQNALYLSDSGGQYLDGTTDITRTIAIGDPPTNAVTDFTLVLKGHIALAMARFPKGTRGVDLDPIARHALWQHGKDYAHGTGHGVGSYLNVHEGPQSISKRGMEPLQEGMIVSNEPGYYVEGEYGIRIENLVLVTTLDTIEGGNIETHGFETLTLAPMDLKLIDKALLTDAEVEWLNTYHQRVFKTLESHLDVTEREWLLKATQAI